VGTQTEAPCKNAGVQVSGCRECLSLALVPVDSRDNCCVRCEQVNDLLSLVVELKEEVERLRSIRECEREIDWWSPHPALPEAEAAGGCATKSKGPPTLLPPSRKRGPKRWGEWKQVSAQGGKRIPSWPHSPSLLPLSNRYGALECEGLATEDVGEGEAPSRGVPRMSHSAPRITSASAKKKRRVIVIGDSILR